MTRFWYSTISKCCIALRFPKLKFMSFIKIILNILDLTEQEAMLKANLDRMYGEPAPPEPRWRRFAQELAAVAASSRRS